MSIVRPCHRATTIRASRRFRRSPRSAASRPAVRSVRTCTRSACRSAFAAARSAFIASRALAAASVACCFCCCSSTPASVSRSCSSLSDARCARFVSSRDSATAAAAVVSCALCAFRASASLASASPARRCAISRASVRHAWPRSWQSARSVSTAAWSDASTGATVSTYSRASTLFSDLTNSEKVEIFSPSSLTRRSCSACSSSRASCSAFVCLAACSNCAASSPWSFSHISSLAFSRSPNACSLVRSCRSDALRSSSSCSSFSTRDRSLSSSACCFSAAA